MKDKNNSQFVLGKPYPIENQARFDLDSIFVGLAKINYLFDEKPEEDDYLDNALNCLRHIGNLYPWTSRIVDKSDKDKRVCLPKSAFEIESVTQVDNYIDYLETRQDMSVLYNGGRFIRYFHFGDYIEVPRPDMYVMITYRTFAQDSEGLPLISEAEAEACAYWWKWVKVRRELYQGNQLAAQVLQLATQDKNKAVNQARVNNGKFSQNFLNQYINVLTSNDRFKYNRDKKLSGLG